MRITESFNTDANLSAAPYNWRTQSGVTTFAASGGVVTAPTSGERTNFFPSAFDTLDQEVEFDLVNLPTASGYFDLFARVRASGTNYGGYYVGPEYISGTGWCISLYKYIGDTYTLGIQSPTTLTAGDRIRVEAKVDGTSCRISVYRNGNKITLTGISGTVGVNAGDWVDSSPLTGLWGGMYSDASGGSAAWQWDNLVAGDAGGEVVSVSVAAAGELGVAFSGKVAAKASMTAGFGAGTADGSVADAVASVAIPADLALAAAALRQASGAIAAGQALGEAWAAQAAAAALLAVSGELGAEFTATSSGSEEAAVTAGTEASASFLAAAQAFGQLIPGATVGDLFVGIAQARGSVDASSSLSYVAAASVAMQVSIETGLELGEAWASHASVMADMASAGEFGISFTAETQAAQAGSFAAGTVAAAQFLSSIRALGALVGVASFGMALQAVATADADLEVVAYLGAAFGIGDMPPTPPIPPGRTVTVMARSRLIRIPSRSRTIRVH